MDQIYELLKAECEQLDAIYEEYLIDLIGHVGLDTLKYNKLIETCGVINGRQLYVLTK